MKGSAGFGRALCRRIQIKKTKTEKKEQLANIRQLC